MISKEWKVSTIGEACDNFDSFRKPISSMEREKIKGPYPYYGAANVIGYINKYSLDGHYVLIAEDGSVIDSNGNPIVQDVNGKFWVSNHSHILKGNDKVITDFIYYYLKSIKIKPFLTGSVQLKLNQSNLNKIPIKYPHLEQQKKIANILSSLDDKIELNNKINQNLEEFAQTLYKRWFVDFEFPNENGDPYKSSGGEMGDSELGLIPNGWEVITLNDTVERIDNRGKTPPLEKEIKQYPIIDVKALSGDGPIIDYKNCMKFVSRETYENWFRNGHPIKNDILISTVGSLAEMKMFLDNKGCIAQNVVAFRTKDLNPYFLFYLLNYIKKDLTSYNIGSVQPSIKVTHIIKHKIIKPNKKTIKHFSSIAKSTIEINLNNYNENMRLIETRDTLLPKLMSGEIEVPIEGNA